MDYIVTATAGHVDHGKTTLIKRLTGIDTDTTPEEKKRGLTINLGFAYFDLPSKKRIAFVDVPGHEKFLKNMISGLTGIDMALLVVDAGEGVMPQTKEHVAILSLLGITNFVVAVTKADSVDPEMCELTVEDIHEQFVGTPVEGAPIVITDAISGRGISDLIEVIDQAASKVPGEQEGTSPRLNVDRVFTIKGHGTVVTGTLIDGSISLGDRLELYPSQLPIRVKNIQVNDQDQQVARPDHRVALNIDAKGDQVHKGDVITVEGNVRDTKLLDVQLKTLSDSPMLKVNERIRLYIGAVEVFGRIYPMGLENIQPDSTRLAQLRLEAPVAVKNGDRFIIRTYSPMRTVAGGMVLSANAKHHSRNNQSILNTLTIRASGDQQKIVLDYLDHAPLKMTKKEGIASLLDISNIEATKLVDNLVSESKMSQIGEYYLTPGYYKDIEGQVMELLTKSQQVSPLQPGMARPEIISKVNYALGVSVGGLLIDQMIQAGMIKVHNDLVSTSEFQVKLTKKQETLRSELTQRLDAAGLTPVSVDDLPNPEEAGPVLTAFSGRDFVNLGSGYFMGAKSYQQVIEKVTSFLEGHPDGMGLGDYRDLTETSRKYAMMVLEQLDRDHVTKRLNRKHVLNKGL